MIHFSVTKHGQAVAEAAPLVLHPEDVIVSRTNVAGKLMGGVVFKNFTGASIEVHCAGFEPNWLCRDLLWVVFDYAFNQLECKKVFGLVPSSNPRALALDYKLGFKYVTTIPGVFLGGSLVVLDMDRTSCRWLGVKPRSLRGRVDE